MRPVFVIIGLAFLAISFPATAEETKRWDFENGTAAWRTTDSASGIVLEPGGKGNHAYRIVATRPHHTRLVLAGSASTPDFVAFLRVKVLEWSGAPPAVFVYGRDGAGGFRALTLGLQDGRVFCYYGQGKPSVPVGRLNIGFSDKPEWIHVAFACFDDYVLAKAWPEKSPEPAWQVDGRDPAGLAGGFALGVWTSPRETSTAAVLFDDVRFVPLAEDGLRRWGIHPGPRPALDIAGLANGPGVFEAPGRLVVASKRTALAFDCRTGEITNFVDIPAAQEFISRDVKRALFSVELTRPYEGRRAVTTSRDFRKCVVRKVSGQKALVTFEDHPGYAMDVQVSAAVADEGTIRLRINVANRSDWCIAGVTFPLMPAPPRLGKDASDDVVLLPWSGGAVLPSPGTRTVWRTAHYPGVAFAQFYALYDGRAGAYFGMYDADGHCKRFQLRCAEDQYVSIAVAHLFPELPGADVELPYDVVLGTFRGDWRDAADIYKAWALKQPWCARRLASRDDVPHFLKDGAGVIIGSIQPRHRAELFGGSLEKLPDLMDAYRERTGLAHMVFVPYGWENRGRWAGINYLPAFPSNEVWAGINRTLKARGHRTAFLTSGFWWVTKRRETSNGPAFDDTADFERRKAMCVHNADGSVWEADWYDHTRDGQYWRGLSVELCHGSVRARSTLKDVFLDVARLGVPLVSFDQEIGGAQQAPCYSRIHGHPPGYGSWMWTGFRDLCADILAEGKRIQPELGLFLENESELAIPYMSTYWSRQFGEVDVAARGGRGVGLFSYLYHEYVTAIGAACVQGQGEVAAGAHPGLRPYVFANNLVRGLIPGPFMHLVPLEPISERDELASRAYFSFSRPYAHFAEYLILGKTRRPIRIECEDVELWFRRLDTRLGKPLRENGRPVVKVPLVLPAVATGSFEAADGSVAAFVVNVTPQPREATAIIPPGKGAIVYRADRTEEKRLQANPAELRIPLTLEPFGVRVLVK